MKTKASKKPLSKTDECPSSGNQLPTGKHAWVVTDLIVRCPTCYASIEPEDGRLPRHEASPDAGKAWRDGIAMRVDGWRDVPRPDDAEWRASGRHGENAWDLIGSTGEVIGTIKRKFSQWIVRVEGVAFERMGDDHPSHSGAARSKAEAAAIILHARRLRGLAT